MFRSPRSMFSPGPRGPLLLALLLLLAALVSAQEAPRPNAAVRVEYDEKQNLTRITLDPFILISRKHEELRLGAVAARPGREPGTHPAEVTLVFLALSRSQPDRYAAAHQLTIIADDERLFQSETRYDAQTRGELFIESMQIALSWEIFERLARARNVTLKLGLTEIRLTPPQITLLRATASYIAG